MRTFLVAGSPEAAAPVGLAPEAGDRVIAVDLGAHHARAWNWPVHLIVGDLDSLSQEEAAAFAAEGVPFMTVPAAKDETDLELGLAEALTGEPEEIILCGALGGRTDHLLANILLLARPDLANRNLTIAEGGQVVRLLSAGGGSKPPTAAASGTMPNTSTVAHVCLSGSPGDLLSLFPLNGDAKGVTTAGLLYPLLDELLLFGRARGVSNLFVTDTAEIWLRRGLLLIVHTRAHRTRAPR